MQTHVFFVYAVLCYHEMRWYRETYKKHLFVHHASIPLYCSLPKTQSIPYNSSLATSFTIDHAGWCAFNFLQNSARSSMKPCSTANSGSRSGFKLPIRRYVSGNRSVGGHWGTFPPLDPAGVGWPVRAKSTHSLVMARRTSSSSGVGTAVTNKSFAIGNKNCNSSAWQTPARRENVWSSFRGFLANWLTSRGSTYRSSSPCHPRKSRWSWPPCAGQTGTQTWDRPEFSVHPPAGCANIRPFRRGTKRPSKAAKKKKILVDTDQMKKGGVGVGKHLIKSLRLWLKGGVHRCWRSTWNKIGDFFFFFLWEQVFDFSFHHRLVTLQRQKWLHWNGMWTTLMKFYLISGSLAK